MYFNYAPHISPFSTVATIPHGRTKGLFLKIVEAVFSEVIFKTTLCYQGYFLCYFSEQHRR